MITIGYYEEQFDENLPVLSQFEGVLISKDQARIMQLEQALQSAVNILDDALRFVTGNKDEMRPVMCGIKVAKAKELLESTI